MSIVINTPPLINTTIKNKVNSAYGKAVDFFTAHEYKICSLYKESYYKENILKGYDTLPRYFGSRIAIPHERLNYKISKLRNVWHIDVSSTGKLDSLTYTAINLIDTSLATAWMEGVAGYGVDESIALATDLICVWMILWKCCFETLGFYDL